MRQTKYEIPDTYVKLDSDVSAADRFVNVRDTQIVRRNHNIICARSVCRENIWSWNVQRGALWADGTADFFSHDLPGVINTKVVEPIVRAKVLIGPFTKEVFLYATGYAGPEDEDTSASIKLYATLSPPGAPREISEAYSSPEMFNESHSDFESLSITIDVPPSPIREGAYREYELALYVQAIDYGSAIDSAVAITAATEDTVSVATAGLGAYNGSAIYFNDSSIQPRVIAERTDGGGTSVLRVRKPWLEKAPSTANTLNSIAVATLVCRSLSLYENPPLDGFSANPTLI